MNTRFTILAAALLAATSVHAQTGPSRVYTPGAFDELEIHGSAEVRFAQGDTDQVLVEGDDEVQREVKLDLRNGRLNIRQSGTWKFWNNRRLQLSVTARDLKRLSISGAADVLASQPVKLGKLTVDISGAGLARFDHLQADELRFTVSGAGDGQFAGSVDQLRVDVSGKSDFRGEQLRVQRGRVSVSGLGDVAVWAEKDLTISVSGIGTVDYWGTPTVKRSSSGLATINARGAKTAAAGS
jgi:hypothetical protein